MKKANNFEESEYIINMFEQAEYVKFAKQISELNIMQKDYNFCVDYIIKNGNLQTALKLQEKENKKIMKKERKEQKKLKKKTKKLKEKSL